MMTIITVFLKEVLDNIRDRRTLSTSLIMGPIFGPILGALYGPVALIWIVLGCIFAGAVHDYFSGMLSVRYEGQSVPDVVGRNLGNGFKQFMRGFSVILLILVGVVFFLGPAALLQSLTGIDLKVLIGCIFYH